MTPREKMLKTLRREGCVDVPVDFNLCSSQAEAFEKRTGHRDYQSWFGQFHRNVSLEMVPQFKDGRSLYKNEILPEGTRINAWGIGHSKGSEAARHMIRMHCPLRGDCRPEDIENYPYPKIREGEKRRLTDEVAALHERGLAAIGVEISIWEKAWNIRGMEDLMADMMCEEESAELHFDKITELACERAAMYAEAGCDIIQLGDDIGMQQSIMMSVELWEIWLKPRLTQVIQAAKKAKPDVLVFYHSCGYILPFLERLADAGVDILNPIQPECMRFEEVYERIGGRMSFWGTIGTQQLLPFGTPEQVRAEVLKNLKLCGSKGGIVMAPTHLVEPEVPWENLQAMVDECRKWKEWQS